MVNEKSFYRNLNPQTLQSLLFATVFLVIYTFSRAGEHEAGILSPFFLILSGYCFSIFFISLLFRKMKCITVTAETLVLYLGPFGFRKRISFKWTDIESASIFERPIKMSFVPVWLGWKGAKTVLTGKVLSVKYKNMEQEDSTDRLSSLRKPPFLNYDLDVDTENQVIILTREPKGGFEPVLAEIGHRVAGTKKSA